MSQRPDGAGGEAPRAAFVAIRPQNNLRGAAIFAVATLIFTIEGLTFRWLSQETGVFQVVFFRALGQLIVLALWCALRRHRPRIEPERLRLYLARGLGSLTNWFFAYYMFQRLEFALATLLSFASSLFVVVLAGPVLGERVRFASWVATVIGLGGIALAAGVGSVAPDPAILFGLGAALGGTAVTFLNRAMSQHDDTATIALSVSVVIVVATAPLAILTFEPFRPVALAMMGLAGLLGAMGMALSIEAYARAEAAFLAPLGYIRLVYAIAMGYFLFGEVPTLRMLAGAAVVVLTTLYVTRSEAARRE